MRQDQHELVAIIARTGGQANFGVAACWIVSEAVA
jgi:hypothetical protein